MNGIFCQLQIRLYTLDGSPDFYRSTETNKTIQTTYFGTILCLKIWNIIILCIIESANDNIWNSLMLSMSNMNIYIQQKGTGRIQISENRYASNLEKSIYFFADQKLS